MSDHEKKAEELAERAGGYLSTAEDVLRVNPHSAAAYAQMANAAATLSVAQRLAELSFIRSYNEMPTK